MSYFFAGICFKIFLACNQQRLKSRHFTKNIICVFQGLFSLISKYAYFNFIIRFFVYLLRIQVPPAVEDRARNCIVLLKEREIMVLKIIKSLSH